MRALILAILVSILTLFDGFGSANAGDRDQIAVSDSGKDQSANSKGETYRGYFLDLSEIAGQQKYAPIAKSLQDQLDLIEGVGLSAHALKFFHSIPVVVDEAGCFSSTAETGKDKNGPILAIACYIPNGTRSGSVWDGERADPNLDRTGVTENTHRGVILVRPSALNRERPVLLHEMLHAYHNLNLPDGVNNRAILFFYEKAKGLYPDDAYVMRNEREFFAVTASVFLSGKADDGATPVDIKEKQPDYYKFLVWLFGVNPDRPHSGTPLASAN